MDSEAPEDLEPELVDDEAVEPTVPAPPAAPAGAPPPIKAATLPGAHVADVSDEDKAFVARVFHQVKDVDFRNPPPPPPRNLTGLDKKLEFLRQRVRELERDLARIGHIWRVKQQRVDEVEAIIAAKETERAVATQRYGQLREEAARASAANRAEVQRSASHIQALEEQIANVKGDKLALEERVASLTIELEAERRRHRDSVGKLEQQQRDLAQDFRAKIEQAQAAFNQLRDQSARTIAERDELIHVKERELDGRALELSEWKASLEDANVTIRERDDTIAGLNSQVNDLTRDLEAGRTREQDQAEALAKLQSNLETAQAETEQRAAELTAALEAKEGERRELETKLADTAAALQAQQDTAAAHEAEAARLQQELDGAKNALDAEQSKTREAQERVLGLEARIAELEAQVQAARDEVRLAKEDADGLGQKLAELQGSSAD